MELVRQSGLELQKKGKNWLCRCPFHDDREASLSVNPAKQLWNCFACEAGGDALKFLQLKEKLTFPEALERLKAWPIPSRPAPVKSPSATFWPAA